MDFRPWLYLTTTTKSNSPENGLPS